MISTPDGQYALVGTRSGQVTVWETDDWSVAGGYQTESGLKEMTLSADGEHVAISHERGLEVRATLSGTMIAELPGHGQTTYGIGFSPDRRYLVSASYDQTVKLWNLERGLCTLTLHGFDQTMYQSVFTGARALLLTSSQGEVFYYNFGR